MGSTPQQSLPGSSPSNGPQMFNPNFNDAYAAHMPSSYSSNEPINDPSSILNAYLRHLPEFQKSLLSSNNTDGPNKAPAPIMQGGGGGGKGKGAMDYLDPIGSGLFDLF